MSKKYELHEVYRQGLSRDALRIIVRQGADAYNGYGYEPSQEKACHYKDDLRAHYWWQGFFLAEQKLSINQIYQRVGI